MVGDNNRSSHRQMESGGFFAYGRYCYRPSTVNRIRRIGDNTNRRQLCSHTMPLNRFSNSLSMVGYCPDFCYLPMVGYCHRPSHGQMEPCGFLLMVGIVTDHHCQMKSGGLVIASTSGRNVVCHVLQSFLRLSTGLEFTNLRVFWLMVKKTISPRHTTGNRKTHRLRSVRKA